MSKIAYFIKNTIFRIVFHFATTLEPFNELNLKYSDRVVVSCRPRELTMGGTTTRIHFHRRVS